MSADQHVTEALAAYGREHGVSEIGIPRKLVIVGGIPLLGTGKVDYRSAQALAEEHTGTGNA